MHFSVQSVNGCFVRGSEQARRPHLSQLAWLPYKPACSAYEQAVVVVANCSATEKSPDCRDAVVSRIMNYNSARNLSFPYNVCTCAANGLKFSGTQSINPRSPGRPKIGCYLINDKTLTSLSLYLYLTQETRRLMIRSVLEMINEISPVNLGTKI